ncbi:two-component system, sensor histidine kinase YcbA [Dethiosulfatibacter aminovorans DSM 17477]|uniref:histidine kinase n=1 Tax=Dethiosulfatibacter aminovorans DSM 17477 TaxID=1121476 RepID=A0A1M6HTN3_9FIRM|nr:ATP-binding protein [Dethiosulfatibacter aminovorans]SHJ25582.1 two-component system, sensor histidine kinase YcbA [Dethiosulfatibacter aminovorans DSM 17477]
MRCDKKKIENILAICVVSIFLGQIYISPLNSAIRFSFSVVALSLMLVFLRNVPVMLSAVAVACTIFVFRCFVGKINSPDVSLVRIMVTYYGAVVFYLVYGAMFKVLDIRERIKIPFKNFVYLFFAEVTANIIELTATSWRIESTFEDNLKVIIIAGRIRTTFAVGLYYFINYYFLRYEKEQRENKFREMVFLVSSLKTELFFLKKSTKDIEEAMNKSFRIYQNAKEPSLKEDALSVSKDIHEIKKDYMRVMTGIERTLEEKSVFDYMTIDHLFRIIEDNTRKVISSKGKKINMFFKYEENFRTLEHYSLISILNNLIINAIDAIDNEGDIRVLQYSEDDNLCFTIEDTGGGIEEEDMKLIFEPGYSTKLDMETGEFSSGIGLTHVKQIVEKYFEGEMTVESQKGSGTVFKLVMGRDKIIFNPEGDDNGY